MMFLYFENTKKEPDNGLFSVLCKMNFIWFNQSEPFEMVWKNIK